MKRAVNRTLVAAGAMILGLSLTVSGPRQATAENLADAMIGAYNTSGLLEQNRALLRAADEDVASAVAALRPVLDFAARAVRNLNTGRTFNNLTSLGVNRAFVGLSASWVVFDGGSRMYGVKAAQETVLATRQTLLSVEQLVLLRAVGAYVGVLLQTENVRLRENNTRVLSEELRASQDRFDVGEVTRSDVALAESRLAAAQSSLAGARGDLVNAKAEYVSAVGRQPGNLEQRPPMPKVASSVEAAQAVAVRQHPDILAAQHQVTAAELTVQAFTKLYGPNATVEADIGHTEDLGSSDYSRDASLGIVMRQPIYHGGALRSDVRAAMARRDAARGNLLYVQRNVMQDVNDAFVRLQVANASLTASRERVRAAQVAFDGIREEATLGARTTLDVLTAEQELLNAQTAVISDIAEGYVARYQL
ncbi:MAG: TolC family outer membrane protein, partial [Planctomycetes bacterium]|nr:TolC family outer membrane protein [Planctomycetota bacterium]